MRGPICDAPRCRGRFSLAALHGAGMLDRLITVTVTGLIAAAFLTVLVAGLAEEITAEPDLPDPTYEMVSDQWATFKVEGYRQAWGRPSSVSRMTIYEPGKYLPGNKAYAVFWWMGMQEIRADFDTREEAVKLVQFIIDNSGQDHSK